VIGYTGAAALVALGLGILLNRFAFRGRARLVPASWIVDSREIATLFERALAERSKIEMQAAGRGGTTVNASLLEALGDRLRLEITARVSVTQSWLERVFDCFFRLQNPRNRNQLLFYTFQTRVLGVKKMADGTVLLDTSLPEKVVLQQKRVHLRLEPPGQLVLGLAVWPDQLRPDGEPEGAFRTWGKPPLVSLPGGKENLLRLVNLSASGLRLEARAAGRRATGMDFEIGQHYMLLMDLYDPEAEKKRQFWLRVMVRNRYEEFETRDLHVGLRVASVGERLPDQEEIAWRAAPADGLPALENWVVRRHIELFREKGIVD